MTDSRQNKSKASLFQNVISVILDEVVNIKE